MIIKMTTTTQQVAKQQGGVPATPKKVDLLKNMLNAPSVMEQFRNALHENASTFVASVIDLYNTDSNLQLCDPKQVVMSALQAAVLRLPINRALGYAYILPYSNSKKEVDPETGKEVWKKVMEPSFQMGYKGYIQLAMRTGQYKTINADVVYEGEMSNSNKLTGEIDLNGTAVSDKIVGYFAYIELLNGFSKTYYMSVEEMARHAKKYSKGLPKDMTDEALVTLACAQKTPDAKSVGWKGNFHAMAIKTVLRLLLSKYGYLSVEMQNAMASDMSDEGVDNSQSVRSDAPAQVTGGNVSGRAMVDFGDENPKEPEEPAVEPGY